MSFRQLRPSAVLSVTVFFALNCSATSAFTAAEATARTGRTGRAFIVNIMALRSAAPLTPASGSRLQQGCVFVVHIANLDSNTHSVHGENRLHRSRCQLFLLQSRTRSAFLHDQLFSVPPEPWTPGVAPQWECRQPCPGNCICVISTIFCTT